MRLYPSKFRSILSFSSTRHNSLFKGVHTTNYAADAESTLPEERVECLVIGAGVVGLAVARALAMSGKDVVVVEGASAIGTGTSSRNSEIIHAGIYYPIGSLKAQLCVEGRNRLYKFCEEHGVNYDRKGKLLVATSKHELPKLDHLQRTGAANGVTGLRKLSGADAKAMEPELQCEAALFSPDTGVVDSHGLMLALQGDAEEAGAMVALNSPVLGGKVVGHERGQGRIRVHVGERHLPPPQDSAGSSPTEPGADVGTEELSQTSAGMSILADHVVNAAGLDAARVAERISGVPAASIPRHYLARGCYFSLPGISPPPFRHLIYPLPEGGGLGVHVTVDLGGQIKFGPDVEWLDAAPLSTGVMPEYDYTVDPSRSEKFYPAIRHYYPGLPDGSLQPSYAGIRPKLSGAGEPAVDFLLQGASGHGCPGLLNLYGIESPGLTSAIAIADRVALIIQSEH